MDSPVRARVPAWAILRIGALVFASIAFGVATWWHPRTRPRVDPVEAGAHYVAVNDLDLIVARVAGVSWHWATIGNPPSVSLRVERVLRGALAPGKLEARWVADDPLPFPPCGLMTEAEYDAERRYAARPVLGPMLGSRLLVAGRRPIASDPWEVWTELRWSYSAAREQRLLEAVRRHDRFAAERR